MTTIHLTLQGKGGVGKSFAASLIAQFLSEKGENPLCIDTDPINATFSGYQAFDVKRLEIMKENDIDPSRFDELMELVVSHQNSDIVIDNGSGSFISLASYLIENDAIQLLKDMGHRVVIHTVITGGQALYDTLNGFNKLATDFPKGAEMVVWLNDYFGAVQDGEKSFEDMKVYQAHKNRINGIVHIAKQSTLFEKDLCSILKQKHTFSEASDSKNYTFMTKNRLSIVKKSIFSQLAIGIGDIVSPSERKVSKAKEFEHAD